MGEANVWQPKEIAQVNANTSLVQESMVAIAAQTQFTLNSFAYTVGSGSLTVYKSGADGDLHALRPGIDFVENTTTQFSLVVAASAGDKVLAIGFTGVTANVDVRDTDIFLANHQAIRDYAGTETLIYCRGGVITRDGGEGFFTEITGAAIGTYVDNSLDIILPSGGDGSIAWSLMKENRSWIDVSPITYIGGTSFSILGDVTSDYVVNSRLKLTGGADRYTTLVSAVYSSPITTITVVDTTDSAGAAVALHASNSSVYLPIVGRGATSPLPVYEDLISNAAGRGTDKVSYVDTLGTTYLKNVSDMLNGLPVSLTIFINPTLHSAIKARTSIADITSQVQEGLDSSARSIFVPHGLYNISGLALPNAGLNIIGDGYFSEFFLIDSADNSMLVNTDESIAISNIMLDNFRLNGNVTNQTQLFNRHGVSLRNTRDCQFNRLWINNVNGDGISFTEDSSGGQPLNCSATNIVASGFLRNGIAITSGDRITLNTCFLRDSAATANPGDGLDIEINTPRSISGIDVFNVYGERNVGQGIAVRGGTTGVDVSYVKIIGGYTTGNTGNGILVVDSQYVAIKGHTATGNSVDGIRLTGLANQCTVAGNHAIANSNVGIQEVINGVNTPNNNMIFENQIAGNNTSNIVTVLGADSEAFSNLNNPLSVLAKSLQIGKSTETILDTDGYIQFSENGDPAAPAANRGRLFVRDDGAGNTELAVRFATGATQVIATQP